jgi:hypothetical protein
MAVLGGSSSGGGTTPLEMPCEIKHLGYVGVYLSSTALYCSATSFWNPINYAGDYITAIPTANQYSTITDVSGSGGHLYTVLTGAVGQTETSDVKITIDGTVYEKHFVRTSTGGTASRIVMGPSMAHNGSSYYTKYLQGYSTSRSYNQPEGHNADYYNRSIHTYLTDPITATQLGLPSVRFADSLKIEIKHSAVPAAGLARYQGAQYLLDNYL